MFGCRSINYQGSEGTWSEQTKTGKNGTLGNSLTPPRGGWSCFVPGGCRGRCRMKMSCPPRFRRGKYVSATLLERIGAKPHQSGLRKIEMMLGASSRVMEVYRIKINSVKGNFKMEAEVTKVKKAHLMMVDNPCYKKLVEKHPHLKGVTMDDNDERLGPAYLCTSS